jgi:hypothetical protein
MTNICALPTFFQQRTYKYKDTRVHDTKGYKGSRHINPLILNLSNMWNVVISFTAQSFESFERKGLSIE